MEVNVLESGAVRNTRNTPEEALDFFHKKNIKFVDLQFTDLPGRLQHVTVPLATIDSSAFTKGIPKLDGSSIKGFAEIHESDMLLRPDPSTATIVPWSPDSIKAGRMICDIYWGFDQGRLSRDPRGIAQNAEKAVQAAGFDVSYWGPEVEFFVLDRVNWDVLSPFKGQSYSVESREAAWTNDGSNYPIRFKEGYYPAEPHDTLMNYRSEVVQMLDEYFGVPCDAHHHEVATAGQCEIDMQYNSLTRTADNVMSYKYVVKNVARLHDRIATFMPKPIFGDNASGMHVHSSLWKGDVPLFYDENDEYAELSQLGRYYGGGLMDHSRALAAIVTPTTNSYRRLVPGFEAPVYIAWSRRNRSANVRIPVYEKGPNSAAKKRIEFRTPDPSCNPYLCFAAILAAGLDGVKKKSEIGDPVDEDIYKLPPARRTELGIRQLPTSLGEAIEALQSDSEFLKPILGSDTLDMIVEFANKGHAEVSARPHPYEFHLYFDI